MSKEKVPPFEKQESFRIVNIQAADIYYSNVYLNKDVEVKNNKDSFNKLFSNLMPINLDLIYLNEKGKFKYQVLEGECFSYDLVDVSFKYTLKLNENNEQVFKPDETFKEESTVTLRNYIYKNGFYFIDEQFSYVNPDLEIACLTTMVNLLDDGEQLFFTSHDTEILSLPFPNHSFNFMKKSTNEYGEVNVEMINAAALEKRNNVNIKNLFDNDYFDVAVNTDLIINLGEK